MHIPICANCWILDTASTALTHEDIQTLQWMKEMMGREQSFLPKPGFFCNESALCQTTWKMFTDTYILFLPHVALETWKGGVL